MFDEWLTKLALPLSIILGLALIVGGYFLIKNSTNKKEECKNENVKIVIDISGAINNPGVYEFENGRIVEDAITAAGGITNEVDERLLAQTINRAALLQNHGKIYIPIKGTIQSTSTPSQTSQTLVNINLASSTELDTLPGIGPVTANKIINYRNERGPFVKLSDLIKIDGISTSKYTKLKDLITI
ncbi:MAG: helix-hairpin-helix domain-containing protein [Patescibacteria group bacterium]|nr:helix-hairpin-helix domain-containing protein [Patescibacteria group bacterium]